MTELNAGKAPLSIQPLPVEGPFTADRPDGAVIEGGNRRLVTLSFAPSAYGSAEETVLIQSNGGSGSWDSRSVTHG